MFFYIISNSTYDCDVSIPCNCTHTSTGDCSIAYCISTNTSTPDNNVVNWVGAYTIDAGPQKKRKVTKEGQALNERVANSICN